jgi:ribosomal protein S18 acetylase RimI-like enzyme
VALARTGEPALARQTTLLWQNWPGPLLRPEYEPDPDLVAETQNGELAAFCIGWLDRTAAPVCGQIEPLGVHPDFRNLGLGRAILAGALRRPHNLCAGQVLVETDNYRSPALELYKAICFWPLRDVLVYRKDCADLKA